MNSPTDSVVLRLKQRARELGFHLSGVTPAVEPAGFARLLEWIDAGYQAGMDYIPRRLEAYRNPHLVLDGVRSLIILGFPYRTTEPADKVATNCGRIARYAWGTADYHDLIHQRLGLLKRLHEQLLPGERVRGVVDSAPLLEREFAVAAGLGWIGKNTMLLNKYEGSYFFLAALLSTAEFPYDDPHATDHCGTCTACLDACPTDAFPQPGVLDAGRCISYLTIEHREPVPERLRPAMQDWLFGCDICQDVCPWNRRGSQAEIPELQPADASGTLNLSALFALDEEQFRRRFRKTPLWRPKRRGILRNAAIVLGNRGDRRDVETLARGLNDDEPLVREACAWALGRIGGDASLQRLKDRRTQESLAWVREQIERAIDQATSDESRLSKIAKKQDS